VVVFYSEKDLDSVKLTTESGRWWLPVIPQPADTLTYQLEREESESELGIFTLPQEGPFAQYKIQVNYIDYLEGVNQRSIIIYRTFDARKDTVVP